MHRNDMIALVIGGRAEMWQGCPRVICTENKVNGTMSGIGLDILCFVCTTEALQK